MNQTVQIVAVVVSLGFLLAVLELVRLGRIRTQQTELFGDIVIERREDSPGDNVPLSADPDFQGGATVADSH